MNFLDSVRNWEFMGEPAVNWFLVLGLLILSLIAWRSIIDFID